MIETIKVHKAPVEEIKVKYAEEIQVQEIDIKYKKVGHLMDIFTNEEKKYIGEQCLLTPSPLRCKAMITHTCKQETQCGKAGVGTRNNLFGVYNSHYGAFLSYNTRMESIVEWLDKYQTYRYNNTCSHMITRSNYCTSGCNDWVPNCNNIMGKFTSD